MYGGKSDLKYDEEIAEALRSILPRILWALEMLYDDQIWLNKPHCWDQRSCKVISD